MYNTMSTFLVPIFYSVWDLAEFVNVIYRFSQEGGWDLAEWLERLAVNAAAVLGSIPASSGTLESEGRQMKQYWIALIKRKNQKSFLF